MDYKEDATGDDVKALISEMDLLSSIEEHPNIVSLIRVCSIGSELMLQCMYTVVLKSVMISMVHLIYSPP